MSQYENLPPDRVPTETRQAVEQELDWVLRNTGARFTARYWRTDVPWFFTPGSKSRDDRYRTSRPIYEVRRMDRELNGWFSPREPGVIDIVVDSDENPAAIARHELAHAVESRFGYAGGIVTTPAGGLCSLRAQRWAQSRPGEIELRRLSAPGLPGAASDPGWLQPEARERYLGAVGLGWMDVAREVVAEEAERLAGGFEQKRAAGRLVLRQADSFEAKAGLSLVFPRLGTNARPYFVSRNGKPAERKLAERVNASRFSWRAQVSAQALEIVTRAKAELGGRR